jgi:hypothetical protein
MSRDKYHAFIDALCDAYEVGDPAALYETCNLRIGALHVAPIAVDSLVKVPQAVVASAQRNGARSATPNGNVILQVLTQVPADRLIELNLRWPEEYNL